ncbi:hypothetical protein BH23ACT5_BH23ACT5_07790 [soil metagenome]
MVMALTAAACTGGDDSGPGQGRLVVTGGDGSVTLVDPVDGSRAILTEGSAIGAIVQPTASPDGSQVVWTEVGPEGAVVVVHEEGELERVGVPTAPFFYHFAPSGDRLAALGNDPGGDGVALIMIDVSRRSAEVVDVGQPYFMDWHPDGDRLVAHIGGDLLASVAADGDRQPLGVTTGPFQAPQVTAEGRVLAVVGSSDLTASASDGVIAQLRGGTLGFLDDGEMVDALGNTSSFVSFEMAANGRHVAFVDGIGRGGTALGPLVVAAVDGSDAVTVAGEGVVAFEWSPNGDHLLFLTPDRQEGFVPHVWDGSVVNDYPGFLPSGVFLTQYLPFWSQYIRSITQWAPDSGAFTYAAAGEDESSMVWIQPLDGERREAGAGEMVTWVPG